ncbi:MAG: TIGR00730 family Rossman fold protein [Bdellovibrionaceae bacterium]|nr:TIGR00730 family Rossman fold protein [Pseudobdellovibrionaceae bacterium]
MSHPLTQENKRSRAQLLSVCIFCGARAGHDPRWIAEAAKMAQIVTRQGVKLIYGGGHTGLMGVIADSALAAGGLVVGVIPASLQEQEMAHQGLSELFVVGTMHERKALMAQLSSAFIALPGGFGTLDEFFEILTWRQLGIHSKPIALLNSNGYFDSLLNFCERAVVDGFISKSDFDGVIIESDPDRLWERVINEAGAREVTASGSIEIAKRESSNE